MLPKRSLIREDVLREIFLHEDSESVSSMDDSEGDFNPIEVEEEEIGEEVEEQR